MSQVRPDSGNVDQHERGRQQRCSPRDRAQPRSGYRMRCCRYAGRSSTRPSAVRSLVSGLSASRYENWPSYPSPARMTLSPGGSTLTSLRDVPILTSAAGSKCWGARSAARKTAAPSAATSPGRAEDRTRGTEVSLALRTGSDVNEWQSGLAVSRQTSDDRPSPVVPTARRAPSDCPR